VKAGTAALVLALLPAGARAEAPVPFLAGRVVDEADMIPADARPRLEAKLQALEQATGAQVAVLTVASLQGEVLEQYTHRVAETWKLGRKEQDDGVLLFVSRGDRKMRIEVGYGLEDKLTDLRTRRILDEVIAPRFKAGDFGGGIEEGVNAIDAVVRGGEITAQLPPAPIVSVSGPMRVADRIFMGLLFLVLVGLFSVISLFLPNAAAWVLYVFLMPFHCLFPVAILTPTTGLAWFLLWVIGFPVARVWLRKTGRVPKWAESLTTAGSGWSSGRSWGGSGGSSGGSSYSSSSDGGSSFSGGGGSFGGGGASSSW
jgi:uncharacterized protein